MVSRRGICRSRQDVADSDGASPTVKADYRRLLWTERDFPSEREKDRRSDDHRCD